MPRIEINGTKLHYQQIGQGPDILLIHGLFSNIAFWWAHIAPRLARHHRVTALDLRGHGLSGMTERGYRAIDLAGDVVRLLTHLNIRTVHVIGHSYGGAIALATATRRPDLIGRITLADAWVPFLQQQIHMPNVRGWPDLRRKLQARGIQEDHDLPMVAMAFLEELAETPVGGDGGMMARPDLMPIDRGTAGVRRWRRLMAQTHAWKEFYKTDDCERRALPDLKMPVEMIYGNRSGYHKTRDGLRRLLPDAIVHETPGGHYFPVLNPQPLTDLILARPPVAPTGSAIGNLAV